MADISDRAYRQGLVLAFLVVFALSATEPASRSDWALENLLVLGAAVALWQVRETVPFSRIASTSIFLFLCAHEVGAHYTYPAVPYDRWFQALTGHSLQQLLGLHRNHYDRFVHTLFGLLLTVPFREVLLRTSPVRGRWSYVLPVAIVMALSAGYEILRVDRRRLGRQRSRRRVPGCPGRSLGFAGGHGLRRRGRHAGREPAALAA